MLAVPNILQASPLAPLATAFPNSYQILTYDDGMVNGVNFVLVDLPFEKAGMDPEEFWGR